MEYDKFILILYARYFGKSFPCFLQCFHCGISGLSGRLQTLAGCPETVVRRTKTFTCDPNGLWFLSLVPIPYFVPVMLFLNSISNSFCFCFAKL